MESIAWGNFVRTVSTAPRVRRLLCTRRAISVALNGADDGDSSAGGGREEHSRCVAEAFCRGTGRGRDARRERVLPRGGRTGCCRSCSWHEKYQTRRQDSRTWQCIRYGREEAG